jgi:hypothetical protein
MRTASCSASCMAGWSRPGPATLQRARCRPHAKPAPAKLVIGSGRRSHWPRVLTGSTVADQVLRAAGELPVQVVNVGRPNESNDQMPGNAGEAEASPRPGCLRCPAATWPTLSARLPM